jgi:hypothetical protein
MPEAGTKVLEGALLKLLYPTGDIVFIRCDYKADVGATLGMLASGVPSTDTNRSCRVPDLHTAVQAETGKLGIKLYMTYLGKYTSESRCGRHVQTNEERRTIAALTSIGRESRHHRCSLANCIGFTTSLP